MAAACARRRASLLAEGAPTSGRRSVTSRSMSDVFGTAVIIKDAADGAARRFGESTAPGRRPAGAVRIRSPARRGARQPLLAAPPADDHDQPLHLRPHDRLAAVCRASSRCQTGGGAIWTTGVAAPAAPVECLAFTSRRRPVRARSLPCTTSIINGTTGTLDGGGYRVRTTTHLLAVHGTAASSFTTELVASVMPGYRS